MSDYPGNLLDPGGEGTGRLLTDGQHAGRVESRMDRVFLGKSLPEGLSLLDKGIPPSSSGSVNSGTTSLARDIWSREFCKRTDDTAHRRSSEPAVRRASNTDCNYPRELGRNNEIDSLSRADARESEEFGYEEIHGHVELETHSYPISLATKSLWDRRGLDNRKRGRC